MNPHPSPPPRPRAPPEDVQRADILAHLRRAPDHARHQRFFSASQRAILKEMAREGIVDRYLNEPLRRGACCPVWVRLRLDEPATVAPSVAEPSVLIPSSPELARCPKCGQTVQTQTELEAVFGYRRSPSYTNPERRRPQSQCKRCRGVHPKRTDALPGPGPHQLTLFGAA